MKSRFFSLAVSACGVLSAVCLLFVLFTTCDIGLGSQVDTAAPQVAITYPPAGSVAMDYFVVAGSCSDDLGVTSIEVSLSGDRSYGPYEATIASDGKSWSVKLNEQVTDTQGNTSYPILDSIDYTVAVTASDKTGHTTIDKRVIAVDNTAPLLLLTAPSSYGTELDPTSLGRTISLEGEYAEDTNSTIAKMVVGVYSKKTLAKITDLTFTDVTHLSVSNPYTIAKWFSSAPDETTAAENYKLYQNYMAMYGDTTYGTALPVYFTLTLTDAAKKYQDANDKTGVECGNSSYQYYRDTEEYEDAFITDNAPYPISIGAILKILNGTGTTSYTADDITAIKAALTASLSATAKVDGVLATATASSMSINPKNNPTFMVTDCDIEVGGTGRDSDGFFYYTNASPLHVVISSGLDNIKVNFQTKTEEDLVTLYAAKIASYSASAAEPITLEYPDDHSKWTLLYQYPSSTANATSASKSVSLSGLKTGERYELVVTGNDLNGNAIEYDENGPYVFTAQSAYKNPELAIGATVTSTNTNYAEGTIISGNTLAGFQSDGTTVLSSGSELKFTGTAASYTDTLDVDNPIKVSVVITSRDDATGTAITGHDPVMVISKGQNESYPNKYNWSVTVKGAAPEEGNYQYAFTITATDTEGNVSSTTRTVYVDNKKPVIALTNTDLVSGGTLVSNPFITENSSYYKANASGSSTIYTYSYRGTWSDENGSGTKSLEYRTGSASTGTDIWSNWKSVTGVSSITTEATWIAELAVTQGTKQMVQFRVVDKCGYVTTLDAITGMTFDFGVPVITLTSSASDLTNGAYTLTGVVTDTYALSTTSPHGITVTAKQNGTACTSTELGKIIAYTEVASGTSYQVKIILPASASHDYDGNWSFTVDAVDGAGRSAVQKTASIIIDSVAPAVSNFAVSTTNSSTVNSITYFNSALPLSLTATALDSGTNASGVTSVTYAAVTGSFDTWTAASAALTAATPTSKYICGSASAWASTAMKTMANDSSSTWTATVSDFVSFGKDGDGSYTLFAKATDAAGNTTSVPVVLKTVADCTKPSLVENTTSADVSYTNDNFTLSGTVGDTNLATVNSTGTCTCGEETPASVVVDNGAWTITQTVPQDSKTHAYTYKITAVDKAGNTAYITDRKVTIDRTAPTVTIDAFNGGKPTNSSACTFTGTCSDNAGGSGLSSTIPVWYTKKGDSDVVASATATRPTSTTWSCTLYGVAEGAYTLYVKANDIAGNTTQQTISFDVDVEAPVSTLSVGSGALYTKDIDTKTKKDAAISATNWNDSVTYIAKDAFTLSGSITDSYGFTASGVVFTVNGSETPFTTSSGSGFSWTSSSSAFTWTYTQPKTDGIYTYKLKTTDSAGNIIERTFIVLVDASGPELNVTAPSSNSTVASSLSLAGVVSDSGVGVAKLSYVISKYASGSWTSAAQDTWPADAGSWTKSVTLTDQASLKVVVTAEDYLGNTSTSAEIPFYYDDVPPVVSDLVVTTAKVSGSNAYNTTSLAISATVTDATSGVASVSYSTDNATWLSMTGSGSTYTASSVVCAEGTNTVYMKAIDKAGCVNTAVFLAGIVIDVTAPSLSSVSAAKTQIVQTDADSGVYVNATAADATSGTKSIWVSTTSMLGKKAEATTLDSETKATASTTAWTISSASGNDLLIPSAAFKTAGAYADGMYTFYVHAMDDAGNESVSSAFTVTLDTTAPTLDITIPVSGTATAPQVYTESSVSGIVSGSPRTATFTVSGTWSDKTAGTKTLQYTTSGTPASVTDESSATAAADKATDAKTKWVTVSGTTSAANVTLSWTAPVTVSESSGNTISFRAKDAYGNVSSVVTREYLTFDFSVPTWDGAEIIDTPTASDVAFTDTVSDVLSLSSSGITITATRNGTTADASLYTVSYNGATKTAVPVKITVVKDDDAHTTDGLWLFTLSAKDTAGRAASSTITQTFRIDTTKPVIEWDATAPFTYSTTIGSSYWTSNGTTKIKTAATDANGSGIASAQYAVVTKQSDSTPADTEWTSAWDGAGDLMLSNGSYTATVTLQEGVNYIRVRTTDNAGNVYTDTTGKILYADFTAPSVITVKDGTDGSAKVISSVLTNGTSEITAYITSDDTNGSYKVSGVSTVKVLIGSNGTPIVATETSSGSGIWKLTLAKSDVATVSETESVYVQLTDKAGNSSKSSLFTLSVDTEVPSSTITSPDKDTNLNGVKTINGTVSDNKTPAALDLYYYVGSTATNVLSDWTHYSSQITDLAKIYNFSFADFDFTTTSNAVSAPDGIAYIWLLPVAYDKAGNCSIDVTGTTSTSTLLATNQAVKYTVDQNSDRPIIKLTNLKSSGDTLTSNTVYGMVTDDDGTIASANFKMSEDNSTWYDAVDNPTVVSYTGGSWTFTLPSVKTQGERTLYFKVTDTENKTFTYDAASDFEKPYVRGTAYTASPLTDEATFVTYTLDTNPPTISSIKILMNGDTKPQTLVNNMKFGKNNPGFKLTVTADDTSGIKTIAAKFADCSVSAAADTKTSATVTKELTMTAPTTDGLYETDEIIITVTDENNSTSVITRTVIVDNQNPTINVVSPAANTQIVGDTEVRGTTSDGSSGTGVSKVQWFIPDNTVVGAWSGKTDAQKDALFTTTLDGTASWSISFTTGDAGKLSQFFCSTTDIDGNVTWYNKKSASATVTYGTVYSDDIWTLPIYFRIEDETGNYTYYTGYTLNVNPDGDRPTTTITYPETDAVLGGTIRVFGTAEDNELVGSVHMQIQKAGYDSNGALTSTYASVSSSYDDVTVTGTSSWNYSIDGTSATFGAPGTYVEGGSNTYAASANYYNKSMIRVRAWALDSKSLKGAFTDWVYITIDKNAPKIGSTNAFTLVQYSDAALTTVSASQTYTSGMYISGTWYLTCSVEDENGIADVKLNSETITKTTNDAAVTTDLVLGTSGTIATGTTGYNIKIKLATEGTGIYKFNVYALDKSTPQQSSTSPVYLKFDNTAPVQTALTHGGSTIGDGTGSTALVQQENYTYLITSSVTEEGSGLKRTAMYLKRTNKDDATNDVRIYDPRFAQTNNSDTAYNRIAIDGTSIKLNDDELPSKAYTSVTRGNSGTFTLGSADKFITKGSIVRIAGVYRLINSVSGATYTFTPEDTTMNTTVEAVYALVVDDTNYETLTSGVVGNDDGDGIYDYVVDDGSSYSWKLAFNSENIPDGPLSICYVSFDDAGNASELKTVSTKVKNNAPRIAKYTLGTDLNGNGAISEEDETISYSALVKNETTGYYEASDEVTKDVAADFTAKALTTITPEIIGGNNGLEYNWDFYQYDDATSAWGAKTTGAGLTTFITATGGTYTVKGNSVTAAKGTISLAVDTSTEKLGGKISDGKAKLAFTFWDGTEETTAGTDSYSSSLTVTMNVDVVDEVVPKVAIDKFHWTSDTDNSLYGSSTANGHIDLEADLPSSTFNATAGASNAEYDTDPKVSGKIKITGSAYDDHALTALWVHVDDFTFTGADTTASSFRFNPGSTSLTDTTGGIYYKLGTYSDGSWTGSGIALSEETTNGWYFTVTPGYLNQTGHYVTWELDLDTSKLGSVVGLDKKIRVIAVDARSTPSASSETANATSAVSTNNVPYYQVDVVPYITVVKTGLSVKNNNNPSVFNRASDGHYPVYEDESVTVSGFNFTTATVVELNGTALTASSVTTTSFVASVGKTAKTGAVTLSVSDGTNTVAALNNVNGSPTFGKQDKKIVALTVAYNAQSNEINNVYLTDDVYFDVWQYKTIESPAVSALKNPTVKIGPAGQIGASFSNLLFFNMPGYRNSGESKGASTWCTQTPFMLAYNGCSGNTFAFDSNGYTYGAVQYQTNNSQAFSGYFWFMFATANKVSDMNVENGYCNQVGSIRLEANAANFKASPTTTDTEWITNLDRITSPVIVPVASSATSVTVHMVYADRMTHQIRYRQGIVNPQGRTYVDGGSLRDIYATNIFEKNYDHTNS